MALNTAHLRYVTSRLRKSLGKESEDDDEIDKRSCFYKRSAAEQNIVKRTKLSFFIIIIITA
jgi:hypothetical protein